MALRKWQVVVTFWAETPENATDADDMADGLSDSIYTYVGALDNVDENSVRIEDADTVSE